MYVAMLFQWCLSPSVVIYLLIYVFIYLFICLSNYLIIYLLIYLYIWQGIEAMLPFISKRKVIITEKDVVILLTRDRPFCNEFSTGTQEQLNNIEGLTL